MSKLKILVILPFALLFICLVLVFIFDKTKAQDDTFYSYSKLTSCTWPIPSGNATMETFYIIEDLYKSYKTLQNYLAMAENVGLELTASLNQNKSKDVTQPVCDFDKCKANDCYFGDCQTFAIDQGSEDIKLKICAHGDALCKEMAGMCVSLCKELPCQGEPCPVLGSVDQMGIGGGFLQTLRVVQSGISDEFIKVKNILQEEKIEATYDIVDKRKGENVAGTAEPKRMTRPQLAARWLEIARAWLTPWSGDSKETKTCAMNDKEMKLLEQGKQIAREPIACSRALSEGLYWPPATSPFCEDKCEDGLTQECQKCLATNCGGEKQRKTSWLADINCRLFSDCAARCLDKARLDSECYNCMCNRFVGDNGKIDNSACQDWLCGGSVLNRVCCQ